ncbi:MAG: hypothetical protein E7545_02875 [Ruminococcaceae bacterium]|nr:hypothetical protein [Oscillospiraceae bacterium]
MLKTKRIISILMVLSLMLLSLTACGMQKPRAIGKYISNIRVDTLESTVVAENDNLEMRWDNEKSCVVVVNKKNGYIWSTIPNDFYNGIEAGARAEVLFNSPLIITYTTPPNNMLKTVNGAAVQDEGFITVKQIENGVQIGYFFNNVEISIPLIYKLYDDHFTVTVDTMGILENNNKVYQVEIAPFLAAIPASDKKDSYVLVPSGSGALMYADERDGADRAYQETVYGNDLAIFTEHISENVYNASLPVFGVTRGENSLFAIIEEGAASCDVKATAGDSTIGYAGARAVFAVRGRNTEKVAMSSGFYNYVNAYSEGIVDGNCTVAYYPLSGEDSGYSGMAKLYRDYISEKFGTKYNGKDSAIYLQVLGGAMTEESFVGIPYKTLESATTLKQAQEIVADITKNTGVKPVVQLKGFGATGLDVGKIGGGFKLNSKLGKWSDVKTLGGLCDVYFDFDILSFNSSGNGFTTIADSAKAENGGTAYQYYYAVAASNIDDEKGRYNLLARDRIADAFNKANKVINDKEIFGLSLSTLGSKAYSDYNSSKYYSKGNLDSDISAILSKRDKTALMTEAANAYAAVYSSHIIATPSTHSDFTSLDAQVPFYRMVFKGLVPIASQSVNTAKNSRLEILSSAETGCGLLYTVSNNFNTKFRLNDSVLAKSVYSDYKENIFENYTELSALLEKVSGTEISKHTILSDGVNQTDFANGTSVIVNYTDKAVETPFGAVEAESFVYR